MRTLDLAILGYGNAGRAFGKLLLKKRPEIMEKYNIEVRVTAIATKTKGTLVNKDGIGLDKAESELCAHGKFKDGIDMSAIEVAKSADYDVLVELTTLEIFSGQPAIDHIKTAFGRGKHVITANKGPIAWAHRELSAIAGAKKCMFFYETTVMDGAPVFNLVEHTLKMCRITEINGILNSTTNFILKELAEGVSYDDAIEKGKKIGFVEADPSLDVLGWDSAAKVCALLNVLLDAGITPLDIDRTGIEEITFEKIKDAEKRGKVIKLLCGGSVKDGKAAGFVKPREIDKSGLFATISGASSVISFTTDLMGTVSVVAHEPGIDETAYGIFGDTLRVIENL